MQIPLLMDELRQAVIMGAKPVLGQEMVTRILTKNKELAAVGNTTIGGCRVSTSSDSNLCSATFILSFGGHKTAWSLLEENLNEAGWVVSVCHSRNRSRIAAPVLIPPLFTFIQLQKSYFRQLAKAVDFCVRNRLCHCDFKPE